MSEENCNCRRNYSDKNRYELARLWKTLAEDAKARLDRAAKLVEEFSENPQTDAGTRSTAIRVYTEALEEFTNISTIYQDIVFRGHDQSVAVLDQQIAVVAQLGFLAAAFTASGCRSAMICP
jgi:hypothetical protein